MTDRGIAANALRGADLDEKHVRQVRQHRPYAQGEGEGEHDPVQQRVAARPGRLYNTGMFGLLAVAQIAWFGAIGYLIFALLQ